MSALTLRGPSCEAIFNTRGCSLTECSIRLKQCRGTVHPDDSYRIPPNLLTLCGTKAPRSLEVLPKHIDKVCQIEKPELSWLHADEKKPKLEGLPKLANRGSFVGRVAGSYYLTCLSHHKICKSTHDLEWALAELSSIKCPTVHLENFEDKVLTLGYHTKGLVLHATKSQRRAEARLQAELYEAKKVIVSPHLLSMDELSSYQYGPNRATPLPVSRLRISLPRLVEIPAMEEIEPTSSMMLNEDAEAEMVTVQEGQDDTNYTAEGRRINPSAIFKKSIERCENLIKRQDNTFANILDSAMERLPWDINANVQIHFPNQDQDMLGKIHMPLLERLDAQLPVITYSEKDDDIVEIVKWVQSDWILDADGWVEQRATGLTASAKDAKKTIASPTFAKWGDAQGWSYEKRVAPKTCIETVWASEYRNPRWQDEGCCEDKTEKSSSLVKEVMKSSQKKSDVATEKQDIDLIVITDSEEEEEEELEASSDIGTLGSLRDSPCHRASSRTVVADSSGEESSGFPKASWMLSPPSKTRLISSPDKTTIGDTLELIPEDHTMANLVHSPVSPPTFFSSAPWALSDEEDQSGSSTSWPILATFPCKPPSSSFMKRKEALGSGSEGVQEPPASQKRQKLNLSPTSSPK